jgi:hypothetical protein
MSDKKKTVEAPLSKIQQILNKIGASDTFTKKDKYKFDKVHDNAFPMNGYNDMADLLMLPTTKEGYKYILSVVDIWSNYCDIEPLKTKTASETLKGMLKIFKRHYVVQPKASIKTDNGGEFKDVFDKWLREHHIAHLLNLPDRHSQMANVENLNRQVGRIIMTYLTGKSIDTGHDHNEWLSIVPIIRDELNKMKIHPKDENPFTYRMGKINIKALNKYDVGSIVYRPLEKPANGAYGKFRSGDNRYDLVPRKVKKVFLYNNNWRYILIDFPNVAYAEAELKPARETEEKYEVRKIIGKRTRNKQIEYLVWYKREKKAQATWQPKAMLLEDGLDDYITEYEQNK